ncbi:hypothetical protein FM038_005075 [Shewanella eurypsychrophilus]|uniref:Uncharacterized protein n=1 Tax=Shewanella eurypsychrophilus TaxID=2593656 RepID=A0ABX6V3D9_9GAMM|nr:MULTISPECIES: hypothetical protein [Shewanella]QFU21582.1 hypothetical protein FS418_06655 [Shewanella sp. YLB-09]QPG56872.1 hypothetical protein FM038_005075 [Shewanella eurypsychrophilus]
MNHLNITLEMLSKMPALYINEVLKNMRGFQGATVRFGNTGKGIAMNYQITYPNGHIRTIHGKGHKNFEKTDEFNSERISIEFSLKQITSIR